MSKLKKYISHSLVSKLIIAVGMTLLITISIWAYFNIKYQQEKAMRDIVGGTDRLTKTIRLGTHYAMMLNSRNDINQIIQNIGKQEEIEQVRIYNKEGQIKYSNAASEIDQATNIKAEVCNICHWSEPPLSELSLSKRTRIFNSPNGYRLLGIISPIYNEPGCSTDACHVHPSGKKILGALDLVVPLEKTDKQIAFAQKGIIGLAGLVFLITSAIILIFTLRFVNRPIRKLIGDTRRIAKGDYESKIEVDQIDEMGQLASAINQMGKEIGEKQAELKKQRDEYQTLFEHVPCLITIQDRNYKLLKYNREFFLSFDPHPGDYCFKAYKGRDEKCVNCPVEKTFKDGQSHYSAETGVNKDGSVVHWILRTSPIRNDNGEIVAALEMSLDITEKRKLEEELQKSEKKYHEIFNQIPNPVFVLDFDTLEILDCNESVKTDYGYSKDEILHRSFMDLFAEEEKERYGSTLKSSAVLNQIKHVDKAGRTLFVNIRISPSEYPGKKVLLVTTSDITKRLEAEQQLIQASKMATLGEMATGIAHELNQPLSVIKTSSSFFLKKINKEEKIDDRILFSLLQKVDKNADRATNIIHHMRQFARKSEMTLEKVQVNDILKSAFEIFSQQLKVRGIEVVWDIQDDLPKVTADPGRLEQVFINLLLNARDAIEEKFAAKGPEEGEKKITIKTWSEDKRIAVEVRDTGTGIPKAIEDKLFEPFFTTKEVGKGTGLGLSISYGIVKECGGDIVVVSYAEDGASFIITFPVPD